MKLHEGDGAGGGGSLGWGGAGGVFAVLHVVQSRLQNSIGHLTANVQQAAHNHPG